jgi:hypothetical protein
MDDLTIGYVESIQAHNPAATAARKAARRVTARATARATLVALARKILAPRDIRGLTDEQLRNRGFAVRLAGGQKCRLLLSHDIRSWGGQEGRHPHLLTLAGKSLSGRWIEASVVVRAGSRDALHDMLVAHIANGDPNFDFDKCAKNE